MLHLFVLFLVLRNSFLASFFFIFFIYDQTRHNSNGNIKNNWRPNKR